MVKKRQNCFISGERSCSALTKRAGDKMTKGKCVTIAASCGTVVLLIIALVIALSYKADVKTVSESSPIQVDGGKISANTQINGKTIVLSAQMQGEPDAIYRLELARSETAAVKLAEKLIEQAYPDWERNGWRWTALRGNTLSAVYSYDVFWTTSYINVEYDQDGISDEESRIFTRYTTEITPTGCMYSPEEAAGLVVDFVNLYSEALQFQTFNVIAYEDPTGKAGFYTVDVQGFYGELPISRKSNLTERSVGGTFHVGNHGIFSICALFMLQKTHEQQIQILSVEEIAMRSLDNFYQWAYMDDILIHSVRLEYFLCSNADGTYTLRPVWSFEGNGQQRELDHRSDFSALYFADDGSLCGVFG